MNLEPLASQRITLPRGHGHGKLLYLDAPSGIAGDMLVASTIDLGVPAQVLDAGLMGLELPGCRWELQRAEHSGIAALRFVVHVTAPQPIRTHGAIVALIERASTLTDGARRLALRTFAKLADAEARVHGVPVERVHFHEVGAVDSIVDIVAAAITLDHLGARVVCSPLPLGRGLVASQHGPLPLPAPATVICLQGIPTYDAGLEEELVTPTGAALVASVCESYGAWPRFTPSHTGFGAGSKRLPDRPNVLRAVLGTQRASSEAGFERRGEHVVIEANIDDMTGEMFGRTLSQLLKAGALDAWAAPITMKKGRPAVTLSALCDRERSEEIARVLLSESTTFGVRIRSVDRIERPRQSVEVETHFGRIPVKVAAGDGLPETAAPEYEACRSAAETHGVPLREVYGAALAAYAARR